MLRRIEGPPPAVRSRAEDEQDGDERHHHDHRDQVAEDRRRQHQRREHGTSLLRDDPVEETEADEAEAEAERVRVLAGHRAGDVAAEDLEAVHEQERHREDGSDLGGREGQAKQPQQQEEREGQEQRPQHRSELEGDRVGDHEAEDRLEGGDQREVEVEDREPAEPSGRPAGDQPLRKQRVAQVPRGVHVRAHVAAGRGGRREQERRREQDQEHRRDRGEHRHRRQRLRPPGQEHVPLADQPPHPRAPDGPREDRRGALGAHGATNRAIWICGHGSLPRPEHRRRARRGPGRDGEVRPVGDGGGIDDPVAAPPAGDRVAHQHADLRRGLDVRVLEEHVDEVGAVVDAEGREVDLLAAPRGHGDLARLPRRAGGPAEVQDRRVPVVAQGQVDGAPVVDDEALGAEDVLGRQLLLRAPREGAGPACPRGAREEPVPIGAPVRGEDLRVGGHHVGDEHAALAGGGERAASRSAGARARRRRRPTADARRSRRPRPRPRGPPPRPGPTPRRRRGTRNARSSTMGAPACHPVPCRVSVVNRS